MKLQHKIKISLTVLSAAAMLIIAAQTGFCVQEGIIPPAALTAQESAHLNSAASDAIQTPAAANSEASSKTQLPDTKNAQQEKKDTILKFVIAMAGVLLSSIIIFLGLTIYNKFFVNKNMFADNNSDDVLNTPKTVEEAVNLYIKRNKLC